LTDRRDQVDVTGSTRRRGVRRGLWRETHRRHRKSVRLETKHSHIRGGVAARKRSIGDAAARKLPIALFVVVSAPSLAFFGAHRRGLMNQCSFTSARNLP
jgi:hypothetical protein